MTPNFSIVIPVFHEEAVINATIGHIRACHGTATAEVIVVDGDAKGKTIRAIQDRNVKAVCGQKGRGNQMNTGAALAQGDIVIFLHADTRLPPDAFALIESAFIDTTRVAGAFDLAIDSARPVFRLIEKAVSIRTRLTRIPYGDQTLFFRKSYFTAIGGFADIPIMEDVEIMRRVKKRGEKIFIIDHLATTSARRWEKEGVLICTLRNWFILSLYLSGVSPERLSRFY